MSTKHARKWTPERLAEYQARLEVWVVERTREAHRFTTGEIRQEFRVSLPVAQELLEALIAIGKVAPLVGEKMRKGGNPLGYAAVGVSRPAVTLQDLMDLARRSVKPDSAAARGRRVGDSPDFLTPTQLKDAQSAANLVAEFVPGAGGRLDRVDESWFTWDATQARWDLEDRVAVWSDQKHRQKWEKHATSGEIWTAALNTARGKYFAAIRNVLDLGAHPTHGMLHRAPPNAKLAQHPALSWKRPIKFWARALMTFDPKASPLMIKRGLRLLALYATRRRQYRLSKTDWLAVRADLTAMYLAGETGYRGYNRARADYIPARYVWRLALRYLRSRHIQIGSEFDWGTARDNRVSIVPDGVINGTAKYASSDLGAVASYNYETEWVGEDGVYLRSLIEGGDAGAGLRDWVLWSTASEDRLSRLGLPPRALVDPSEDERRRMKKARKKGKMPFFLKQATLTNRLREISRLCGFLQHEYEPPESLTAEGSVQASYDFTNRDDLSALLSLPVILAYSEWRREESDETEDAYEDCSSNGIDAVVAPGIVNLALNIAKLGDPYLRAQSTARALSFEKAGDRARAESERDLARMYKEKAQVLTEWALERKSENNTNKDIQAIAAGWMGGSGREGWLKLGDLVDLLLEKAEREVGLTIEAQVEAVRKASRADLTPDERRATLAWQTHSWAALIRHAMLVNFARKVPIRARAISEFRLAWWRALDANGVSDPWSQTAAVAVSVPPEAMKSSRAYNVSYVRPQDVGVADIEHGTYRDLVELWLRPHGARDMVLTLITYDSSRNELSREIVESAYFFPPFAYRKQVRGSASARWQSAALSCQFEALVHEHSVQLGLDLDRLGPLHGSLRFHVIRLLYGTYWAPRALLDTKLMLHHVHAETTERLYCGKSAEQVALEAPPSARRGRRRLMNHEPSALETIQAELATALARAEEAERRAITAEARAATAEAAVSVRGALRPGPALVA